MNNLLRYILLQTSQQNFQNNMVIMPPEITMTLVCLHMWVC